MQPILWTVLLGLAAGRSVTLPRSASNASCRAIPGDASWPSLDKWYALNETVHGRLIATTPLPSVCHSEPFGNYNADVCSALKTTWLDDTTLSVHLPACIPCCN